MTSPNNPPQTPSQQGQNRRAWLCRVLSAFGVTLVGVGVFGYVGVNRWINQELPLLVETELSKILKRKVNVGDVKNWHLTGIRIGESSIPATTTDSDYVKIKAINVSFNPIPVLLSRTLPINITVIKPEVYLEENKQGEWIDKDILMQEEGEELPVKLNATVRLQDAQITLLPQGQKIPLSTQINGFVNYNQTKAELVTYDIDAGIARGNVEIEGETQVETGKTTANIEVNQLNLTDFSNFIPQDIASISQGNLNANLDIDLPSFSQIPSIQGQVRLDNLQAKTQALPLPIIANTQVNFEGQKVRFENTKGSYGNLIASLSGDVDLNQGFNLQVNTNAVNIPKLVQNLPLKLPIAVAGKLQAQMFLRGALTNPVLIGKITNKEQLKIEKTAIQNLRTTFVANTSQATLQNLSAIPAAGGEIKAQGKAIFVNSKTGKIDFNQARLAFDLDAQIPNPEALISPYGVSQELVQLGKITAEGQIRGTIAKPLANLTWNLPNANISSIGEVGGVGEIILAGNQIDIRNTVLKTKSGQLKVSGRGNFANQTWQGNINANSFPVHPFLSQVKLGEKAINQPIILDKGEIKLAGRFDNFDLANIQGNADLNLNVTQQGKVTVKSRVNNGRLQATVNARQVAINKIIPNLPLPLNLVDSQVDITGYLQQLLSFNNIKNLDSFRIIASGNLATPATKGKGSINFNARSNLADEIWQANVNANSLPLNPVISKLNLTNLPLNQPLTLNQGNVNLIGRLDNLDINNIQGVAKLNLNASNGKVLVDSRLNQGIVNTQATARGIALGKFISDLPLAVNVVNSKVDFSSPINQLIALNFNDINANATANLAMARGTINTKAKLQNGILSSDINATNINTPLVCRSLAYSCPQLSNLFAKFNLIGDINPFLQGNSPAIIQTKTASLKLGEQSLNAEGKIYLNPVDNQPIPWDVGTELNITADSNLSKLPFNVALSGNQPELRVDGKAQFQGKLQGQNLVSAPFNAGNLQLVGDLALKNFVIDNIDFQPLLTGTVNIDLGRDIALNLQGKSDKIAAQLQPCNRQQCLLPYLPVAFELKQGTSDKAILLSGKRQGDNLDVDIQNFSLALLNAVPIVQENIPGSVAGIVTGEVDINLFNLATAGNINVKSPDLGYIKAKDFAANFAYNGEVAQVSSGFLELGETRYDFQGKLNLNSGDIGGRLVANSARLQDIITAVNIPLIQKIFANTKTTNYGDAADVSTQPVGNPQGTIFSQLRLLSAVRNRLQELAAQKSPETQFNPFNIKGDYNTEIIVAGKLTNPTVDFQLEGNNWLWGYPSELPTNQIDNSQVANTNQILNITSLIARGNFQDGTVNLQPVRVNLADGTIAFQGTLGLEGISGNLDVNNFPIATVERFIDIPIDVAGNISLQANLGGSLFNPQVPQGQISLVNGKIEEQSLGEIAGNFSYTDSIFQFNTTPNSSIQLQASVPYTLQSGVNNSIFIDTKFAAELLALMTPLTQGKLEWVKGDGEVQFQIEGPLNWQAKNPADFLENITINSTILLENATIKPQQIGENIDFNLAGNFALANDLLQVEKLEGNLSGSPFSITGDLPLFQSIPDSSNPFTLAMGPGNLNLSGLYKGKIDANVIVSQTLINPVITGKLTLDDGRVYLPKQQSEAVTTQIKTGGENKQTNNNELAIVPRFDNFQIVLDDFKYKQSLPRANFRIAGELTLNGLLNNLQPQGTLKLERGSINIADNSFLITRDHPQKIEFVPQQGILNPNLNIQLQTTVVDAPRFDRPTPVGSEIRDDIITPANPEQIDVQVNVQGTANQLISSLNETSSDCQQNQNNTLLTTIESVPKTSPQVLENIATCINSKSQVSIEKQQWLINPAIELTSMPSRNETEIMALLANRSISSILEIEEKLTEGKEDELLETAVVDYFLTPIITELSQEFFWRLQKPVDDVGEKIGLSHLQIFPYAEGVKQINQNSSVKFIYDYNDSQFRVIYENKF